MKKVTVALVSLVCCLVFLSSCGLVDKYFPKADPILYPDIDNVTEINICKKLDDSKISIVDRTDMKTMINILRNGEPTRNASVNDTPCADNYYSIEICEDDVRYLYYLYEENGKTYIESPYEGVYRVNNDGLYFVEGFFS